jgi:hypothetical protein
MVQQFQQLDIFNDFYTNSNISYIFPKSIFYFQNLKNFIQLQYPIKYLNITNLKQHVTYNRIIYSVNNLYELNYYKNIFIIIPLYIGSDFTNFLKELTNIKKYIVNIIYKKESKKSTTNTVKLTNLLNLIGYKIVYYSPVQLPIFNTNITKLHSIQTPTPTPIPIQIPTQTQIPTHETVLQEKLETQHPLYEFIEPLFFNENLMQLIELYTPKQIHQSQTQTQTQTNALAQNPDLQPMIII